MKKSFSALTLLVLVLAASPVFDFIGRNSAGANSKLNSSSLSTSSAGIPYGQIGNGQSGGISLPRTNIYALTTDNTIYVLTPGSNRFLPIVRVTNINGNLIGLDFRPADGSATSVYGLTDTGSLYLINLTSPRVGATTLVSTLTTRFTGGFQSIMDFNPVVNALRVIGSNDQNMALVNSSGGNLNVTAPQTSLAYAASDVNASADPNITAGAYTNNYIGAPNTIFYMIDYDQDTFVTIAPPLTANGSSNTGGGLLQTIGRIVDLNGNPINFAPTAGLDIYTDPNGINFAVAISGRTLYTIDLTQINSSLPLGTTQTVVARSVMLPAPAGTLAITGSFIDVAIPAITTTPAIASQPTLPPSPGPTPPSPGSTPPSPGPTPSATPVAQGITPILECVSNQSNGSFIAVFGYLNQNPTSIAIPIGVNNNFSPGIQDRNQPINFLPGRQQSVVALISNGGPLTWNLNGSSITASQNSPKKCQISSLAYQFLLQRNQQFRSGSQFGSRN